MVGIVAMLGSAALAGPLDGPTHTFGARYRHGSVPSFVLDSYYFDADDSGALDYARPKVRSNMFGLEYTFAMQTATFVFWAERVSVPLQAGYWDDKEEPAEHTDGDWIAADGLGAWTIGANYAYEIPIVDDSATAVKVTLGLGGGLGVGVVTGTTQRWHPGFNPDNTDPTCGTELVAPDRVAGCPADGSLAVPKVVPVVDVTLSPKVEVAKHAMIRLDFGIHDFLYWGVAAGGTL